MQALRWDIFCRVIDNFGDIGVCWRLSATLAMRGQCVRLWVDDACALVWMAPDGATNVRVMRWESDAPMPQDALPGDVVIEAFGCEVDHAWIAINNVAINAYSMWANGQNDLKNPVWINLEYLSAESYVERSHGLRSPVLEGAAMGMDKWFFYPGFTPKTGGLIHDAASPVIAPKLNQGRISLFCYEPPALKQLLDQLAHAQEPSQLIVMQGRAQAAVNTIVQRKNSLSPLWNMRNMLSIQEQKLLSQSQYDALLRSCDLNFVRGEDSLVRAIWAGRAFVWQIYPQVDGAHEAKLEAFLDWFQAPLDLREFHRVWNGLSQAQLPEIDTAAWAACAQSAQARLLAQPDLVSQLLDFVEEKRKLAI